MCNRCNSDCLVILRSPIDHHKTTGSQKFYIMAKVYGGEKIEDCAEKPCTSMGTFVQHSQKNSQLIWSLFKSILMITNM